MLVGILTFFLATSTTYAIDITNPPAKKDDSPLLITAYGLEGNTAEGVSFIEIYNTSKELIALNDWSFSVDWTMVDNSAEDTTLEPFSMPIAPAVAKDTEKIYLQPKQFAAISFANAVDSASLQVSSELFGASGTFVSQLSLSSENTEPYVVQSSSAVGGIRFLGETSTGYTSTGAYYQYPNSKIRAELTLYDGGLYQLGVNAPLEFPLAPVEILANPIACAPLNGSVRCRDYVKFYNNLDMPIDFDEVTLNIGSLTSSKQIPLAGTVKPGQYIVFSQIADGANISISNSGGYVWLSDRYGVSTYKSTVTQYADASSATRKGQSWALIQGVWQWSNPSPASQNEPLPPLSCAADQFLNKETGRCNNIAGVSSLTPCRSDQYRSNETNRCRLKTSLATSLTPCAANQYRNLTTNRCRLIATTTSSLKPCAANQYRSTETNRCRLIASTASSLKPCLKNQYRSPETNRCRKKPITEVLGAKFPVEKVPGGAASSKVGWVAFAGVGSLALGYGVWEWRRELGGAGARIKRFFVKGSPDG